MAKVTRIVDATSSVPTFDDIKGWYESNMAPDAIDLEDPKPFEVYEHGRWCGVFQCTGQGAQRLFIRGKPRSIIDIAALTSIYRPGPLAAHVDKLWLEHAEKPYDWGHPLINETLKETRGLLVFQEGVMALANKVAGFPMAETDEVRRAIMKRSISGGEAAKKKMQELEDGFVQGCVRNGVPEATARKAYETICFMSGYGFNKSHAVAYAIDSFWCAWLLTYHEEEWICAYLESMSRTPDQRAKAFGEVKALGYRIVPIDINHANVGWTILPGKRLMPSMASAKGIGATAVEEVVSMRPFRTLEDLLYNDDGSWRPSKFNKKSLESLVSIQGLQSLDAVGEGKLFRSYRHMHHVLFGSHVEMVTKKRKGVMETFEKVIDHSALIKRSPKKDPQEGRRNLYELARTTAKEFGEEWNRRELAAFQTDCFGTADLSLMFDPTTLARLAEKGIGSIEDLEVGQTDVVWFITVAAAAKKGAEPVAGVLKQTRNKKTYAQAFVTGLIGKPLRLNVWGAKELLEPYHLCAGEVKRDDYGLSTTSWKVKVIE